MSTNESIGIKNQQRPQTTICRTKFLLLLLLISTFVLFFTSVHYGLPPTVKYVITNNTLVRHVFSEDYPLSRSPSNDSSSKFSQRSLSSSSSSSLSSSSSSSTSSVDLKAQSEMLKQMFNNYSSVYKVPIVNCANIFKGVSHAIDLGIQISKDKKKDTSLLSDWYYINLSSNCRKFIQTRGYITSPLTQEEKEFPLAFSIITYKDIEMVDRLLRSIYRPQNFYCIHVDLKSTETFYKAATAISKCLPNVFLSSKRISVTWGTFSVLEPEIICMDDLYKRGYWKYFINLTGQEMPLKTNYELVKILTAYKGANDLESTVQRANKERWKDSPPPRGLRPLKGSVHIVVNRAYVDYLLHNETAMELLEWVNKTEIPDETYFTMLNHNPQLGIPGSFKGWPETDSTDRKPFLARYKNWGHEPFRFPCAGYWTRGICILSTGDLPLLATRPELFANKFHLWEDRTAVSCMEEKQFNDTRDEYLGTKKFNSSFYQHLGFVRDQVKPQIDSILNLK